MKQFNEYLEELCREHHLIKHSDDECHFSDMTSDFENKLKRLINYPCISLDTEGFSISGEPGAKKIREMFSIYVLEHVRDTGNYAELAAAFAETRQIVFDFLRRMERDRRALVEPMTEFSILGTEGTRIEFKDAGLYGWVVSVLVPTAFKDNLCNDNFER